MRPDSGVPDGVPTASGSAASHPASSPADAPARAVMSPGDVSRALRRIAHEILERNKGADDLVVLGIPTRGVALARRLVSVMEEVEGRPVPVGALDVTMHRDDLRRQPTRSPMHTDIPPSGIDDKVVVLVDDVLYSGRTVRAALDALSDLGRPRAVRLAVLVDRGHRDLPIRADHVGKNLPTSSSERVQVRLSEHDGVDDEVRIAGGEPR
ncbi:bifunctional pyr operon transcriptional regulator/uracil phosphoribosyltransferase PyrR [Knoellia sp. p5-6-4]|uniref:bifunctional pyr operon transcriptional regulator/uracil phosphoribosyltransferase PyrR n=1 Tax=unclassified Knoellia TaxID=2618719 RepID=UPI0023DA591B|nr:bifunctional pyr operon transcriptional regulator/uracil phosphoribosyltransferase PyrR [Knoellia sp. p5-6-4]MDF2145847.1 bifunctional pyr operon transcriptional regulator/uracil phosphoribosyltransferase PyrR [Knoellia sp. p5-6-4]